MSIAESFVVYLKMPELKFEGNFSDIAEKQLGYISGILEELGYKNEKVLVESVGGVGDNFVANIKRFIVEKNGATFKMIAKIAPTNEMARNMMGAQIMFHNEHVMYMEVLPKLAELQKAADVPENERFTYAACYGTSLEAPYEIILLEDLKTSDYTILDKFTPLTNDTVKLILKNFASFHAASYALRNQESETYAALKSKLINNWLALEQVPEAKEQFEKMESEIMLFLDDEKLKNGLRGTIGKVLDIALKNSKVDSVSKYSVITQGDSWTNNFMFVLEDEVPKKCCMIDYQLSKEGNPVSDLHYFIFNCTDYESRSKHQLDWMDFYHSELDKALAHYGLKTSLVYPRDQFDADLRRYGKLGLALTVMVTSVLLREASESAKIKESWQSDNFDDIANTMNMSNMEATSIERIKTRLEGLIKSFIEFGYV